MPDTAMPCSGGGDLDAVPDLETVILRASIDRAFRRRLLTDAPAAIAETFGVTLPTTLRLRFLERDPDVDLMIVLPDLVDADALDAMALRRVIAGLSERWINLLEEQ